MRWQPQQMQEVYVYHSSLLSRWYPRACVVNQVICLYTPAHSGMFSLKDRNEMASMACSSTGQGKFSQHTRGLQPCQTTAASLLSAKLV